MYFRLTKTIGVLIAIVILLPTIPSSFAELELFTNSEVYSDGEPLFVYGKALPKENLILRIFAPDGTIAKFDQVIVDEEGSFNHILLTWPETSTTFP